jgi:ABC-type amino acid transport substrate-binding protein
MRLGRFADVVTVAVLALVVVLQAACRRPDGNLQQGAARPSVLESVKRTGRLKAGFIKYPPFVFVDPRSGALTGYFIDLVNAIALEGGFTVDYEETTWAAMVTGLQTGKFDLVVSGVFRTIPRAKEVTFTSPLLYVGISAIARKDDRRFATLDDLQQPGLVIAVTNGEVGHEYARRFLPRATTTVLSTEDISRPMLEVTVGRADIALGDSLTAARFAAAHPEVRDLFAANPFYVFGTTMMVRRGDPEWLDFLNIAIEQMELSGVTSRLEGRYKEGNAAWISKRKPWN